MAFDLQSATEEKQGFDLSSAREEVPDKPNKVLDFLHNYPQNMIDFNKNFAKGGIKGLASLGKIFGLNTPQPSNTTAQKVGYFLGETAPYLAIPEMKLTKLNKFGNMLATGATQGSVIGATEALKNKENPLKEGVKGAGAGLGLSLGLSGIPFVAVVVKRISETLPKGLLSLFGINPKTFQFAVNNKGGEALLRHPDLMASESNLNKITNRFLEDVQNYKNKVQSNYEEAVNPIIAEQGQMPITTKEENMQQMYDFLKSNRLLNDAGEPTALGKNVNYNSIDNFIQGYNPTLEDMLNLRKDIDKEYIRWNKINENPKASESALMSSAKDFRSYLNDLLQESSPAIREADTSYAKSLKPINTPSIDNIIKQDDIDKSSALLKSLYDKKYQGFNDLQEFEKAMQELGVPTGRSPISERLKYYYYADIMPKTPLSAQFFAPAVRRSLARPIVENIALPIARNKTYQDISKSIGSGMEKFSKSDLNKLIPFIMTPKPLQGGIEYNEYR